MCQTSQSCRCASIGPQPAGSGAVGGKEPASSTIERHRVSGPSNSRARRAHLSARWSLKGVSSRRLRQEYDSHVRRYLWGGHFWSDSYFAGSRGGAPLTVVKQHIENQQRPV